MEEFIRQATEQMRCIRAREYVARELTDHILDQAAVYEEEGVEEKDAVRKAVREMGDPVEIGVELDRIHRPQTDYKMIGMAFLFSLVGMFILYTAGGLSQAPVELFRQCLCLLLSFGLMAGMYFLDYSFLGKYAYAIYAVMTIIFFVMVKSASSGFWVAGVIPAMLLFVYLYIPVFAGILYRLRGGGYGAVGIGIGIQIATAGFAYYFSGTFHTAVIVYGICLVLFLIAIRKKWFAVNGKAAAAIVLGVLVLAPVMVIVVRFCIGGWYPLMMNRLQGYLHSADLASGAGYIYQYIRGRLGGAKLIGAAADSTFMREYSIGEPYIYRTEPFILLELVCRFGILAGVAVVLAFAAVIVRAFYIVKRQKNQIGFMMSTACFLIFLVNCTEGVLVNTGYYPVTSMQLPFVSYGAGATFTYAILIGLLLSIYRNERVITERTAQRPAWKLRVRLEKCGRDF